MGKKVIAVCLNPTFQRTMVFEKFEQGEVNRAKKCFLDVSGKGANVAKFVRQLGADSVYLTHLGGYNLDEYLKMSDEEGIATEYALSPSTPIRTCTTVICGGKSTELVEEAAAVENGTGEKIIDIYRRLLPKYDAVVFSGTKAQGYPEDIYPEMVALAGKAGKLTVADFRGKDLIASLSNGIDILKINLSEFARTFLSEDISEQEDGERVSEAVKSKMKELYELYGTRTVLSHGTFPSLWFDGKVFGRIAVEKTEAANTIGCGDAMTAGITVALLNGATLEQAAALGHAAAAKNASNLRPTLC